MAGAFRSVVGCPPRLRGRDDGEDDRDGSTTVTNIHVEVFGEGAPALFVHGSFGWGLDTFPDQRALAGAYRVMLVDRRGFGGSRSMEAAGWPIDMDDLIRVLEGAGETHLVGQSYGAVVALLAAGVRPELVRSLVVIEPPAYGLARGNPDADATAARLKPVFDRAGTLSTAEFVNAWGSATGMTDDRLAAWTASFGDQDWAAADASRRERWPGDAPIDIETLRAAAFPKVVVRGAWVPTIAGRDDGGRDFAAVCHALAVGIDATEVVFSSSTHNPQIQEPDAFNALLQDVWASSGSQRD